MSSPTSPSPASGPTELMLTPGAVDLAMLRQIQAGGVHLSLDPSVRAGMARSQAAVQHIVDSDEVVYGINTGFGKLASTRIPGRTSSSAAASCAAASCTDTAPSLKPGNSATSIGSARTSAPVTSGAGSALQPSSSSRSR